MSIRNPGAQERNEYGRDWGNYALANDLPNAPGFITPTSQLDLLEAGDTAYVGGILAQRYHCISPGTSGAGDASWVASSTTFSQRVESRTATAIAGQQAFFAGRDAYLSADCILSVTVDGTPAAYAPMGPQIGGGGQAWPQASTADIARGAYLTVPCAGGETVVVTYSIRVLQLPPPFCLPVYAPGGVVPSPGGPNTVLRWSYVGLAPDSLITQQIAGLQIEVWRKTRKSGSVRTSSLGTIETVRSGRHYSPWWRAPVAATTGEVVIDPQTEGWSSNGSANNRKRQFKLAYFDPTTGARTPLSDQTIFRVVRDDRISNTATPAHPAKSLWVGR